MIDSALCETEVGILSANHNIGLQFKINSSRIPVQCM